MLSASMMVDWRAFLLLVGQDSFYLSILLFLGILHGVSQSRLLARFFWLSLLFLTVTYLVDSFVLLALSEHAPLFDVGRYALEPDVVLSFFDSKAIVAIVLLLVLMLFNSAYGTTGRRLSYLLMVVALAASVFSFIHAPLPLARYAMLSPARLIEMLKPSSTESVYTPGQGRGAGRGGAQVGLFFGV
jgi:hypothetical protein